MQITRYYINSTLLFVQYSYFGPPSFIISCAVKQWWRHVKNFEKRISMNEANLHLLVLKY